MIEWCVLENYRQFEGRQRIRFSRDPKRNITLIVGSNGTGKTNILRAICWCLFGKELIAGKTEEGLPISAGRKHSRGLAGNESAMVKVTLAVSDVKASKLKLTRAGVFERTRTGQTRTDIAGIQYLHGSRPRKQRSFSLDWPIGQESLWQFVEHFNMLDNDPFLQDRYNMLRFFEPGSGEKTQSVVVECGKIFRAIVGKEDYCFSSTVILTAEHQLRLVRSDGFIIKAGAAQSEVLRLALSLAARKISRSRMPMILDSPFLRVGRYAPNILKELASLGTQVIILALDTEVSQVPELDRMAGKQYLIRQNPKTGMSSIELAAITPTTETVMRSYRDV